VKRRRTFPRRGPPPTPRRRRRSPNSRESPRSSGAKHAVRVDVVHPSAVFDTGIWSDGVLARRAASYGLTVEEYRRDDVLGVEIASADLARMVVAMCGPPSPGRRVQQVPVDGGKTIG
jgi:hypothetical protein